MFGSFDRLSFLADVSRHEGRSLELLLASADRNAAKGIGGAIIDASYVNADPPLLARLAEAAIPWVINPQSVRFVSPRIRSVGGIKDLPYLPDAPLSTVSFGRREKQMVKEALEFQARHEPAAYLVPALPTSRASQGTFRAYRELHEYAADLNGSGGIPYRPMIAAGFPSLPVMRGRWGMFDRLDRTFAASYVQALQLNTRHDSVEKLVTYVRFLQEAGESSPPIIAGSVGPFGLVLAALGIELFESNLDAGGSFSLSRLERPPRPRTPGKKQGGRDIAVYFEALRTPIPKRTAVELLGNPSIAVQLACTNASCRGAGRMGASDAPRSHFFHVRHDELDALRRLPSPAMRVPVVHAWIRSAIDVGRMVNRVRSEVGQPSIDFTHLDRWLGVLARVAVAASAQER